MEHYRKLTPRLRRFVEAIVAGKKQIEATLLIKPDSTSPAQLGSWLRRRPHVAEAIEELEKIAMEDAGITALGVLLRVNSVADRCMQAEEVFDREGKPTGEYLFDSAGANRALELLGKYRKLWTEKFEATGKDGGPIEIETHNARERNLALIQSVAGRIAGGTHDGTAGAGTEPADGRGNS
jgi:phage terminase small subunit